MLKASMKLEVIELRRKLNLKIGRRAFFPVKVASLRALT